MKYLNFALVCLKKKKKMEVELLLILTNPGSPFILWKNRSRILSGCDFSHFYMSIVPLCRLARLHFRLENTLVSEGQYGKQLFGDSKYLPRKEILCDLLAIGAAVYLLEKLK